jgi:hypothetical protein
MKGPSYLLFYETKVAPDSLARDLATSPFIFHRLIFYRAIHKQPLYTFQTLCPEHGRFPLLAAAATARM